MSRTRAHLLAGALVRWAGGCEDPEQMRESAAVAPAAVAAEEEVVEADVVEGARVGFYEALDTYIATRVLPAMEDIPAERQIALARLAAHLQTRTRSNEPARVTFICTHNSRRSHMAQLWAATAAAYYGHEEVETFSGGTEATAFAPRAVEALGRAGFVFVDPAGAHPRYQVTYGPTAEPMVAFSKVYSDPPNPTEGFVAVMTCSQADRSCPLVEGASLRVSLPYVDPKEADDTPEEAARYDERTLQIASEMFYLMSRVEA